MPRLICLLLLITPLFAPCQKLKTVESEYTYYAPETLSLEQAKEIALERAKIQVIADEFGTVVSQTNYTTIRNANGNSAVDFQSIGYSDLRGEWIETIGNPTYSISYSDGMQAVNVMVKGKIREIKSSYAQIQAKLLRNMPELRFESAEFRNNDDLFVHFISPVNGFLSIYLIDNSETAFCLLPYARQTDGIFTIEANKEYILFSKSKATLPDRSIVDEYVMTCGIAPESNKLAIIFSENPFVKSSDIGVSDKLPRQLSAADLNHWLAKSRARDTKMQYIEIPFKILP